MGGTNKTKPSGKATPELTKSGEKKGDEKKDDEKKGDEKKDDEKKKKKEEKKDPYAPLKYKVCLDSKCDWQGALNFQPKRHGKFGYLLFWSGCGGLDLVADITVVNPFASSGQTMTVQKDSDGISIFKCVGLIENFLFNGAENDPIRIAAYVSAQTAANLHSKFLGSVASTALQVSWYVISCDGYGEGWYEAAYVNGFAKASANIDTIDGDLQVNVADEGTSLDGKDGGSIDVRLYKFEFQIVPASGETSTLQFATSKLRKLTRSWAGSTS